MILARTEPRARTLAQRRAALAKAAISPTNWPSRRIATRYSRWPRESDDITSRDRDAPCLYHRKPKPSYYQLHACPVLQRTRSVLQHQAYC